MGVIRSFFIVLVSVLLFVSFVGLNLFGILSLSLNYDQVQKAAPTIANDLIQDFNLSSEIQRVYPELQLYCLNNSDYVFSAKGYTFDIPCSSVNQGDNAIINEGVNDLIHQVYYTSYSCNFLDCAKSTQIPLFLISQKAYDYWTNKFYIFLVSSLIFLIILFLLTEKKSNASIISGILLTASSILFIKFDAIINSFSDKIVYQFLTIFFSQAFYVSLRFLILGILILIAGIVFKLFNIGMFISNLIGKIKKIPDKSVKDSAKKK